MRARASACVRAREKTAVFPNLVYLVIGDDPLHFPSESLKMFDGREPQRRVLQQLRLMAHQKRVENLQKL